MLKIQRHILSTCCSDLSVPWRFLCPHEEVLFCVETPYPGIIGFTDVVSASEDDTETLELFPEEVRAELKEYLGECGTMVLTLDVVEQVISWYEKSKDRRLCEIAFEAYDLFCRSLSVSYSAGTDFIQIADHSYWLYNPEENTGWEDMFPVSPVCDLCGIVLYVLGKAGGVC